MPATTHTPSTKLTLPDPGESEASCRELGAGLIVIAPSPPPAHGVSVATLTLLRTLAPWGC